MVCREPTQRCVNRKVLVLHGVDFRHQDSVGGTIHESAQTLESIQKDFDRIALLTSESWDHNSHYHRFLLAHLPTRCEQVLEIGCGTGSFSRLLAQRARRVLGIDLSPQMIHIAQQQSQLLSNLEFVVGDVLDYPLDKGQFDCIASLTTLHHLPAEAILNKVKLALKPGGVFVCLDLYQRSTLMDLVFDTVAYFSSPFLSLVKTGKLRPSRELADAYDEHGKTDTYLTMARIKRLCEQFLPGAVVKRHLFWRYSIVWRK